MYQMLFSVMDGSIEKTEMSSYTMGHHIDVLKDYILNTPEDAGRTYDCVKQRNALIDKNLKYLNSQNDS